MLSLEQRPTALVSGYIEVPSNGRVSYKPDKYSRLQVLAAGELLRSGQIERVVFLAGDVPSESNPEPDRYGGIGARMAAQLRRNMPNLPESAIVCHPVAKSTRKEVAEFRKLARTRGWGDLMVIGKESHLERVQRAVNRIFGRRSQEVSVVSQESVLSQFHRYDRIIDEISNSPAEEAFAKREHLINKFDGIPMIGGILLDFLNRATGVKILESKVYGRLIKRT
jgi:hypothetical protein